MRRFILSLFFPLMLIGCSAGDQIESTITRFHQLPLTTQDKSFVFQPTKKQSNSLEFSRYTNMIAEELAHYGMREVSAPPADYGVSFSYGVGDSKMIVEESRPYHLDAGYGFGWGGPRFGWGLGGPIYPPTYSSERMVLYPRTFSLQLHDLKTPGEPTRFEGRAVSMGVSEDFFPVSRCLIHSLFVGFPGEDGERVTVALPANSCINSADASSTDTPAK